MSSVSSMRLRAVIFDVDGTIADTEEAHRRAFNKAFDDVALGWHWQPDLYKSLLKVTGGKERMHHYASLHHADRLAEIAPRIADFHAVKTRHFADIITSGAVAARPGIIRLMREAMASDIRLAIATTMSRPSLDALLPRILEPDCYRWFGAIATGDRVGAKKPAPDLYELALAELGIDAIGAIAIEDSSVGLRSATAAGITTLITPSTYTDDDDFNGAATVVSDLGEPDAPLRYIQGRDVSSSVIDLATLQDLSAPI